METANCLPKSCENKIRHKNGNISNETLQNHCNVDDDDDEVEVDGVCCDGGGDDDDDPAIEALSSQLKDVCAVGKVYGRSSNGFWLGTNCCENGIDKGKCINVVANDTARLETAVKVVTDSATPVDGNCVMMGQQDDDESSSSTTTLTTTISTASPQGSQADFDIVDSSNCASDRTDNPTADAETEHEDCEIVDRCGPFECTYVSCNERKTVIDASSTVEARKPSVASAAGCSHSMPPHHQPCSPHKSDPAPLVQIKCWNSQQANDDITDDDEIRYEVYTSELQMGVIMRLIQKDLSEPYSIYTYRYFIHNWPKLCFLAMHGSQCVGSIVCKLDLHKKVIRRGYIAMLAVDERYRKRKIGSNLVLQAIQAMIADDADEVVLETEISNKPALRLYENLGFVRDKRLFRYYLNGVDALRLKLWLH